MDRAGRHTSGRRRRRPVHGRPRQPARPRARGTGGDTAPCAAPADTRADRAAALGPIAIPGTDRRSHFISVRYLCKLFETERRPSPSGSGSDDSSAAPATCSTRRSPTSPSARSQPAGESPTQPTSAACSGPSSGSHPASTARSGVCAMPAPLQRQAEAGRRRVVRRERDSRPAHRPRQVAGIGRQRSGRSARSRAWRRRAKAIAPPIRGSQNRMTR
jgi:hypothetical protein